MRKTVTTVAFLASATVLMPMTPAHAEDAILPEGYVCPENSVPSTVTGPGPAEKKDRNGDGYVCYYTNPKSGNSRFIDDEFVGP